MADPRDDEPKPTTVCGEARIRFKRVSEAEDSLRKAILDDKKFRAGDQWAESIRIAREGGMSQQGEAAQPPKPCLTIDRISAPVRQVSNTVRAANFSINVMPDGHGADDETAKIIKGILRRVQNDARADDPIDWAADGAAEGGIGWFRILTEFCYDDPDDAPDQAALFDQDLKLTRIPNSLSVYCDPAAVRPTRSDAKYMFVTEDVPRDEFERLYGKDKLTTLDEFRSQGDEDGWIGDNLVRVAEYWRVTYEKTTIDNGLEGDERRERTIFTPTVKWSKITACHELEKGTWAGTRIPLIPVLGEELNVDGKAIVRGVVRGAKDPQRMVNFMYSEAVFTAALSSKAPFIIADGQLEGYEKLWQNANTHAYSYLPYKLTTFGGTPAPPPQRDVSQPPIAALVELLVRSEDAVKATTSIYDPSLGNTNPREKSGRAIMALQQQSEQSNSNYLDNVQRAMVYAGELLVELCPKIYDRPGRILRILGIDDEPQQVQLGGGEGAVPLAAGMQQFYDLSKGNYAVTVTVGKAWSTKREEQVAVLGEMIAKQPSLLPILGDLYFKAADFPGAMEAAERFKKMLPPNLQDQGGDAPPEQQIAQLQQQLQQLSEMSQLLTQELQKKTEIITTEQVQAERDLALKQMEIGSKERIEYAKIQSQLTIEEMKAGFEAAILQIQGQIAMLQQAQVQAGAVQQQGAQQAHEAAQAGLAREAESGEAEAQRGFEAEQADAQRGFDAAMGAEQMQHDRVMQSEAPPPGAGA